MTSLQAALDTGQLTPGAVYTHTATTAPLTLPQTVDGNRATIEVTVPTPGTHWLFRPTIPDTNLYEFRIRIMSMHPDATLLITGWEADELNMPGWDILKESPVGTAHWIRCKKKGRVDGLHANDANVWGIDRAWLRPNHFDSRVSNIYVRGGSYSNMRDCWMLNGVNGHILSAHFEDVWFHNIDKGIGLQGGILSAVNCKFFGGMDECIHVEEKATSCSISGTYLKGAVRKAAIRVVDNDVSGEHTSPDKIDILNSELHNTGIGSDAVGIQLVHDGGADPCLNSLISNNYMEGFWIGVLNGSKLSANNELTRNVTHCDIGYRYLEDRALYNHWGPFIEKI